MSHAGVTGLSPGDGGIRAIRLWFSIPKGFVDPPSGRRSLRAWRPGLRSGENPVPMDEEVPRRAQGEALTFLLLPPCPYVTSLQRHLLRDRIWGRFGIGAGLSGRRIVVLDMQRKGMTIGDLRTFFGGSGVPDSPFRRRRDSLLLVLDPSNARYGMRVMALLGEEGIPFRWSCFGGSIPPRVFDRRFSLLSPSQEGSGWRRTKGARPGDVRQPGADRRLDRAGESDDSRGFITVEENEARRIPDHLRESGATTGIEVVIGGGDRREGMRQRLDEVIKGVGWDGEDIPVWPRAYHPWLDSFGEEAAGGPEIRLSSDDTPNRWIFEGVVPSRGEDRRLLDRMLRVHQPRWRYLYRFALGCLRDGVDPVFDPFTGRDVIDMTGIWLENIT